MTKFSPCPRFGKHPVHEVSSVLSPNSRDGLSRLRSSLKIDWGSGRHIGSLLLEASAGQVSALEACLSTASIHFQTPMRG